MNTLEQQVVDACHLVANAIEGAAKSRAEIVVRVGRLGRALERVPSVMHDGQGTVLCDQDALDEAHLELAAIRAALGMCS